ncbi:MAG: glycerophosphodiester phosphodiesterase family protein [Anaerolineales bacterium]|jgi:glycerophosphoryl diester phosphodiesterase
MWNDLSLPVVIAHRGDKQHAPENTLAAFKLAAENGADAIEFDLKLTADGRVVVLHDQTVNRTSNGTGRIYQLPFAAVRDLDAGTWFSGKFQGERIPTLNEVFESVDKRMYFNVELANYATPGDGLVNKVVDSAKKHNLQNRILFSSFYPRNLQITRSLMPEVPRGLLCKRGIRDAWKRTFTWQGDYFALHPHLDNVHPRLVSKVHASGKRVHVWTVNQEEDLKRMIDLGVDAIITDNPVMALHLLGRSI